MPNRQSTKNGDHPIFEQRARTSSPAVQLFRGPPPSFGDKVFRGGREQAYVWVKARLLIRDPDRFRAFERQILDAKHGSEWKSISKAIGRTVGARLLQKWDNVKSALMLSLVCRKFCQNQQLASYLLNTKNAWLIEANPGDSFWGAGLGVREIEDRVRQNGVNGLTFPGGNHLGKIIMRVRSFLAGEGGMPRCLALGDSVLKGLDFPDASVLVWPGANLEIITLLADLAYIPGAFSQIVVHAGTNDLADLASGGVGPGRAYLPIGVTPQSITHTLMARFSIPAKQFLFFSTYWASENYNFGNFISPL